MDIGHEMNMVIDFKKSNLEVTRCSSAGLTKNRQLKIMRSNFLHLVDPTDYRYQNFMKIVQV